MRRRRVRLALMYAHAWHQAASDSKHHETIRRVAAAEADSHLKAIDKESTRIILGDDVFHEAAKLRASINRLASSFQKKIAPGRPPLRR